MRPTLATAVLLSAAASLPGQQGGPPPPGLDREAMWPAPTAEDWARPCLIHWQRTWEDAVAVSKETGKPILVCVNMDGEIASEHWAGIRYRSPETAKLFEPYVCVIASVYRHNPRDYDDQGRRIECPRFGTVTCGEHIWIEPLLFGRYFEGRRVAPRHIMVELDQSEVYDVYYAWDTASVEQAIEEGISRRKFQPPPPHRGDRSLLEKVASRDSADREEVERAFLAGDAELRRALITAAGEVEGEPPLDLLRLAVFSYDLDLSEMARRTLARTNSESAVPLITEALKVPMAAAERQGLLGALDRIGRRSERARRLAVVYRGLDGSSDRIDLAAWSEGLAGLEASAYARSEEEVAARLEEAEAAAGSGDAAALLEQAEARLAWAVDPAREGDLGRGRAAELLRRARFEDVLQAARRAEEAGASGWRLDAVFALAAHFLGDTATALVRSEAAVRALPPGEPSWNAVAVLGVFAGARRQAILDRLAAAEDFPPEWLADVHAAWSVIERHPLCTDDLVLQHHDFLISLEAADAAREVLLAGLRRFPDSWKLHTRLRLQVLKEADVPGLEETYRRLMDQPDAHPHLGWFAGYAEIVAGEIHRRRHLLDRADEAYRRAIELYRQTAARAPETAATGATYQALAEAGLARVAFLRQDLDGALAHLEAAVARDPRAAATRDGLNLSAVDTARSLLQRAREAGREDLAARVETWLEELRRVDPALLERPAWDRGGRPSPDARRRAGR
ncbi:MAG: hypothetical protein D6702_01325 [Planctomycetota bacterium]|nr:MAG: hypothetical protein D6702_01325 [Planctomycetota bacterium]